MQNLITTCAYRLHHHRQFFVGLGLILAASLGLTSCKDVKIENGEIPSEYLADAKKLEGDYSGNFNGKKGILSIVFSGAKPRVYFHDSSGAQDLIDEACSSKIGDLTFVTGNGGEHPNLQAAKFSFDPRNCVSVTGRQLELSFSSSTTSSSIAIRAKIEASNSYERVCEVDGGFPPKESCHYEQRVNYLTGDFHR